MTSPMSLNALHARWRQYLAEALRCTPLETGMLLIAWRRFGLVGSERQGLSHGILIAKADSTAEIAENGCLRLQGLSGVAAQQNIVCFDVQVHHAVVEAV